jgi:hypothetical protein
MSHKKHQFITAELCIESPFQDQELAHLFEHVRFLEERMNLLEEKYEHLEELVATFFDLTDEDDDGAEAKGLFSGRNCILWHDDEEEDED